MQTIAVVNEKGGTAKTTTAVNLAAALGLMGKRVLLVDLDGQAASSRWLGSEEDTRLADAILSGGGLEPLDNVLPGVSLAPASGKLDSVAHDLRPTQGGQLRRVITQVQDRYDYVLIDCPPSLGNRLIGNALLAASHAIVPVEASILALDGLRILLTMLEDIRQGFDHQIELIGVVTCRYDHRTRLSRLVLAELKRALGPKVFRTVIHETVRLQECPASGRSIFDYAPDSSGAQDYRALAEELVSGNVGVADEVDFGVDLATDEDLSLSDRMTVVDFREQAAAMFGAPAGPEVDRGEPQAPAPAPQVAQPPQMHSEPSPADSPPPEVAWREPAAAPGLDEMPFLPDVSDEVEQAESELRASSRKPNKRLVEVSLVLLAAAALLGWWLLLGTDEPSPRSAAAHPSAVASAAETTAADVETPAGDVERPTDPFGMAPSDVDVSPPAGSEAETPDPFAAVPAGQDDPGSWPPDGQDGTAGDQDTQAQVEPAPEPTLPTLNLTCIMKSSGAYLAIINGEVLRVGQSIQEAEVVDISAHLVTVSFHGKRYALAIGEQPVEQGSAGEP
jgi:chromosome partitioning protein